MDKSKGTIIKQMEVKVAKDVTLESKGLAKINIEEMKQWQRCIPK